MASAALKAVDPIVAHYLNTAGLATAQANALHMAATVATLGLDGGVQ